MAVAVTSPNSGPSECFKGAASSTVPGDAATVLLASEKVEQGMPCPDPAEHWDQRGCVLLLRCTLDLPWCVLDWG